MLYAFDSSRNCVVFAYPNICKRTLNKNGKTIWYPTNTTTQQASNIFTNMSNPNFPQDKLIDVFLDILKINPYNAEYHKFMISRFGENDETTAIKNYFGYTDFDNPRIT